MATIAGFIAVSANEIDEFINGALVSWVSYIVITE